VDPFGEVHENQEQRLSGEAEAIRRIQRLYKRSLQPSLDLVGGHAAGQFVAADGACRRPPTVVYCRQRAATVRFLYLREMRAGYRDRLGPR
jgi:hypothetical protein